MTIYWVSFLLLVVLLLAFDLGVLNRKNHVVELKEALGWTAFWVFVAMCFNVFVYFAYENHWGGIGRDFGLEMDGRTAALQFLAAYLVEKSLSLDNIFVFAVIFRYFAVRPEFQHRVLFWGIIGALVLRGVMIAAGAAAIARFVWVEYLFGAILLYTAYRMAVSGNEEIAPDRNPLVRLARRFFPVTQDFHGDHFFVREGGRLFMTPMFLVLLVVESTDVLFAVDSIPAVFAVSRDKFIVFTSNIFAILGLRALYFALGGVLGQFKYLKHALVVLLGFVGVKMILAAMKLLIPVPLSLGIIVSILALGIIASLVARGRPGATGAGGADAA
ncbi:MAG: TerC family protein [Candidatus Sumerlaeia bacterium]|nr:TerC family protein [Candidatus Sumerlaeia bacterium]